MYKNPDFTDLKLETFLELLKRDFSSVRNMSATCAIIFICVIVTTSSV